MRERKDRTLSGQVLGWSILLAGLLIFWVLVISLARWLWEAAT